MYLVRCFPIRAGICLDLQLLGSVVQSILVHIKILNFRAQLPFIRVKMDRKSSRNLKKRSYQYRMRRVVNRYQIERGEERASTSAKKLKGKDREEISVNNDISYRILNFVTVFDALSQFVKCNGCGGAIKFTDGNRRGLGFKILLNCDNCEQRQINSCPHIGLAYEINIRFFFAMRLLGVSLAGCEKFCAFMDMPRPIFKSFYSTLIQKIRDVSNIVRLSSTKRAAEKEKALTFERNPSADGLTISGDGSWRKRGFSSLHGVATLIGYYTKKVIDVQVKSSFCHACSLWTYKSDSDEYIQWHEEHMDKCEANHEGSAGKMEGDAIIEMFKRSIILYQTKYINYIGDGDSKTYKQIVESAPYGDEVKIMKKECINHVQKRMGSRLRKCKKGNKGLGGKGKLTGKLIDELGMYYGLAIRRNADNHEKMTKAVWATFYHKISTNESPRHEYCPEGTESWCSWQRAKAEGSLDNYQHAQPLHPDVIKAIEPIYKELSKQELLKRCLGAFNQNNNESLNAVIWKFAPKIMFSGTAIVETAVNLATILFNDGHVGFLTILQELGVNIGEKLYEYCLEIDQQRVTIANKRARKAAKEASFHSKYSNIQLQDKLLTVEELLYSPGIAD